MLTNAVPPYRYPIFAALLRSPGRTFHWFLSGSERESSADARATLPLTYLGGITWLRGTRHRGVGSVQVEPTALPVTLPWRLYRFKPDVIVSADFGPRAIIALAFARLTDTPFVLSSEETAFSASGRSATQRWLRKTFASACDAALAWGMPARDYLMQQGAPVGGTVLGVQPVDVEKLVSLSYSLDRTEIRAALRVTKRTLLLVGRLLHLKGFHLFVEAWSRVPRELRADWSVLLVGEGPERSHLGQLADRLVPGEIRFEGLRQGDALARYFAVADLFVMPSLVDVWGLVINEALCFGIPVLASRYAGAAQQLVTDEQCGEIVDPKDVVAFAKSLSRWVSAPPPGSPATRRERASEHNFEAACAAINTAVDVALARRGTRARWGG